MSIQPKQNSKRFNALDMLLIMIGAVLLFVLGAYGAVHGWLFRRSWNRAETMTHRTGQYQVQPNNHNYPNTETPHPIRIGTFLGVPVERNISIITP